MEVLSEETRKKIIGVMVRLDKTVCMPQARFDNWIKSLTSGEYKQAKNTLFQEACGPDHGGYCCLGVEQQCNSGLVDRKLTGEPAAFPKKEYLLSNNIIYMQNGFDGCDPATSRVTQGGHQYCVSDLNDEGTSFEEIAQELMESFISLEDALRQVV